MRDVYPVKYYKDEGFVEYTVEIDDEDLRSIILEYLHEHSDFSFDEMELVNKRPFNIWLLAKCRKFVESEDEDAVQDAEVAVRGSYEDDRT